MKASEYPMKHLLPVSLDEAVADFAACWSIGGEDAAIAFARIADKRYTEEWYPEGTRTPTAACPEADEASGWLAWPPRLRRTEQS